jgi:hypothetical protein
LDNSTASAASPNSNITFCFRSTGFAEFDGLYQKIDPVGGPVDDQCVVPNAITGACVCPNQLQNAISVPLFLATLNATYASTVFLCGATIAVSPTVSSDEVYVSSILAENPVWYFRFNQNANETSSYNLQNISQYGDYPPSAVKNQPG